MLTGELLLTPLAGPLECLYIFPAGQPNIVVTCLSIFPQDYLQIQSHFCFLYVTLSILSFFLSLHLLGGEASIFYSSLLAQYLQFFQSLIVVLFLSFYQQSVSEFFPSCLFPLVWSVATPRSTVQFCFLRTH